jgi:hypothetical protein
MDPLVEEYGKLALVDRGRIDVVVRERAVAETRRFML